MRDVARGLRGEETAALLLALCSLQEADLPRHVHRIYLSGSNSFGASWRLPWEAGHRLRRHVRPNAFAAFAERANEVLQWQRLGWEELTYGLLSALAYPAAYLFLRERRRQHELQQQ